MQVPLQVTMHNVPRSSALEARIRQCAAKLERFHARITTCRVAVDEVDKHHQQGRHFRVKVEIRAPGREEVVSSLHDHEDVYVAVREAFHAARRQLEDVLRESRGDVKAHAPPRKGKSEA